MASLSFKYGKWYIVAYNKHSKKYRWKKLGKCTRKKAEDILRRFEVEEANVRFQITEDDEAMTFSKFANSYVENSKAFKAEKTIKRDALCARNLVDFFGTSLRLVELNIRMIEKYMIERLSKVTPRTVNIELGFIRKMYRYAVKMHYLKQIPYDSIVMVKEVKKAPRFLSQKEYQALVDSATPWIKPFVVIGANAGMRKSEILNLKWKHIEFDHRFITVQSEGEFQTKTRDYRTVPLNQALYDDLQFLREQWPHPTHNRWMKRMPCQMNYVICKADGSKVDDIKKAFANACKRAGLEDVTPHTLRHTYASHLVMSGAPLRTVQHYLGHTNILTTMRYAHLSTEHLTKDADKICFRAIVDAPVLSIGNRRKSGKKGN